MSKSMDMPMADAGIIACETEPLEPLESEFWSSLEATSTLMKIDDETLVPTDVESAPADGGAEKDEGGRGLDPGNQLRDERGPCDDGRRHRGRGEL